MNYQKHYDELISRALARTPPEVTESHHIIPRCMGGSDSKKNRAALTPAEHYVAHQLLVRIYPAEYGLAIAAALMARDNRNGKRSNNKLYSWLRKKAAEANTALLTGKPHSEERKRRMAAAIKASELAQAHAASLRGVPRTEEVRAKVSLSHKTSIKARLAREALFSRKVGVPRADSTKAKISAAHSGRALPDSQRRNISAALKGKPKSAEHVAKVSAALMGRPGYMSGRTHSEETKTKMRDAATGRKMSPEVVAKMVANKTPEQRSAAALKAWETKRGKAAQKQA